MDIFKHLPVIEPRNWETCPEFFAEKIYTTKKISCTYLGIAYNSGSKVNTWKMLSMQGPGWFLKFCPGQDLAMIRIWPRFIYLTRVFMKIVANYQKFRKLIEIIEE